MSTIRGLINNFTTTITSGINNVVTTIPVASVTGIVTELATSDFVPMTLDDGAAVEIVHVTGVSGSDLTVVRGQEGSAAASFGTGTSIEVRLTKQAIMDSHEWRPVEVRTLGADTTNVDFLVTDFTGVDHKITFHGVKIATDAQDLHFQQMTGGGPAAQTTTYFHSGNYMTYLAGSTNNPGNNSSQMILMPAASNSALNTIEGYFEMANPSSSSIRHVSNWLLHQQSKHSRGTGIRDVTEAVTGFRFKLASGDFKAGSKFVRYVRSH